jgi:hypothetical protein
VRAPAWLGAQAAAQRAATSPAAPLGRTHAPRPTSPAITAADLMTRLFIFADDSMQGRETGTEGNRRGLRYIEGELKRLGLTPMGDNGTYLQEVPLVKRGWNSEFTVSVDGKPLAAWSDVVPLPLRGAKPRSVNGASVIYGGTLEEATKALTADQANGRIVVIKSPGGLRVPRLAAGSPLAGAAGIALSIGAPIPANFLGFFRTPGMSMPDGQQGPTPMGPSTMVLSANALQQLFGVDAAALTPGQVGKALTTDLAFVETPAPGYNVVAMIPGTDPVLKGQFVAVGAHNDHVGFNNAPVDHDSLKAFNRTAWTMAGAYAGLPPLPAAQRATIRVNVDSLRALRPARPDSINNGAGR